MLRYFSALLGAPVLLCCFLFLRLLPLRALFQACLLSFLFLLLLLLLLVLLLLLLLPLVPALQVMIAMLVPLYV